MKKINYKPNIMNLNTYYNEIKKTNFDGIFINIVMEEDYIIKVYEPSTNTFFKFEDFLEAFKNYNKLIIINMLLGYVLLNETDSQKISEFNKYFVKKTKELISKYNNNFYISTFNESILYFLKTTYTPYKIGVVVTRYDLNFKDVNFYMFNEYYLNVDLIYSLIAQKKEVMIFEDGTKISKSLPQNIIDYIYYIIQTS